MTLETRQREFCDFLIAGFPRLGLEGWSRVGACAVTGNGTQENLCKPVTTGRLDHGSNGILQWRLDRLTGQGGMQPWCMRNFGTWTTLEAQAAFTLYETARDYPGLDAALREGKRSIENLTANFQDIFERPNKAYAHLDNRIKHAKNTLNMYKIAQNAKGAIVIGGAAGTGAIVNQTNGGPPEISLGLILVSVVSWLLSYLGSAPKKEEPESEAPIEARPGEGAQVPLSPLENYKQKLELLKQAQIAADEARRVLVDYSTEVTDLLASVDLKIIDHVPALTGED